MYGIVGKDNFVTQFCIFNSKKTGQNLGGAGRVQVFMNIFGIQNTAGVDIHQDGGFCTDFRSFGPVLRVVALNRQELSLIGSLLKAVL